MFVAAFDSMPASAICAGCVLALGVCIIHQHTACRTDSKIGSRMLQCDRYQACLTSGVICLLLQAAATSTHAWQQTPQAHTPTATAAAAAAGDPTASAAVLLLVQAALACKRGWSVASALSHTQLTIWCQPPCLLPWRPAPVLLGAAGTITVWAACSSI